MANIQGDLFNQPEEEPVRVEGAADAAKAQLTEQARKQRAELRERNARRAEKDEAKHRAEIERALEQGIDLRTERDFRPTNAKYFADRARAEIKNAEPPPEQGGE